MASERRVPQFATEAEEADWWYENREQVEESLRTAMVEGRTSRGTAIRRVEEAHATTLKTSTVALDVDDARRAHAAAERRGMPYQEYIKMLVHEALEKEAASA